MITTSSSKGNHRGALLCSSGEATKFLFQKNAGIRHSPISEGIPAVSVHLPPKDGRGCCFICLA